MEKVQITKSQKILFAVLGVVLAYAIFDFVSNKDTYLSFYSGKQVVSQGQGTTTEQNAEEMNREDPLQTSLFSQWGNDPFLRERKVKVRKKVRRKKKKVRPTFKLKAISYRTDEAVALINDRVVKAGDIIEGYQVLKVGKKTVVLWDGKERLVLKLANM